MTLWFGIEHCRPGRMGLQRRAGREYRGLPPCSLGREIINPGGLWGL